MTATDAGPSQHATFDPRSLTRPAVLIFNPKAGRKLGLSTSGRSADRARVALEAAGIPVDAWPTKRADHATELARRAVIEGRELVIAAGGDGTVSEVAHGLAGTNTVLGVMPLGSIMNVARTLCLPRDLDEAARVIANGRVLTIDVGKTEDVYFLEAAGVGLDAGLFGYFEKLDRKGLRWGVVRAALRFMRQLGTPRLIIEADGRVYRVRTPMVSVANSPFVGAAYALSPDARLDDGLLHVTIFSESSVLRLLVHLLGVAGARRLAAPSGTKILRARSVRITTVGRRPLPVHADGVAVGATPAEFEAVHCALRVIIGEPEEDEIRAWKLPESLPDDARVGKRLEQAEGAAAGSSHRSPTNARVGVEG